MRNSHDHLIDGPCSIAVRDYGGTGRPILLLHGAGRNLCDWTPIAHRLAGDHRVVAMDLRGHGHSDEAPWTWDDVLDDINRVLEATGLERPAVVGHSLGGMIAALYSANGGSTSCLMNLDGFGPGRPEQYVGIPPETVREFWRRVAHARNGTRLAAAGPIAHGDLDPVRAAALDAVEPYGIPAEWEADTFDRSARRLSETTFEIMPSADVRAALRESIVAVDWFAVFRRVTSPFVIYKSLADVAPGLVEHESEVMAAYRRGLLRDLASLAEHSPNIQVRTIETNHGLVLTMPDALAAQIHDFVDSIT